jgi:hypothetical protein
MNFDEYKRKLLEEDEYGRLTDLQAQYNGVGEPNYSNLSLRDELQTRFDLSELKGLQQKYGIKQTLMPQSQIVNPTYQSYVSPNYSAVQQYPTQLNQPGICNNTTQKRPAGGEFDWNDIRTVLPEIELAVGDLSKNYWDMKRDNTVGGDDYFHCKANYEAASRGNMGAKTAEVLGDAKESSWDYWSNRFLKGLTKAEADLDKSHDKQVNKMGRQLAQSGLYSNSRDACNLYRVTGINEKY